MRMTLHTDYALRMLVYLALRSDRTCTVSEVADAYGLSHGHLLKVAQTLRGFGFIKTLRGRSGGVQLAAEPGQINLGALVRATEDDLGMVECMTADGGRCRISPACTLKGMLWEARAAYFAVLNKYTIADVVRNRLPLHSLLGIEIRAA